MSASAEEVLVVDDDAHNRMGYGEILRDAGYLVREAPDGSSCLSEVAAHPPSLILLDVSMPGIDGFEVLRRLRDGVHRDIPVILLTGKRLDPESIGSGLELGAEEYLPKPVRPGELRARVRALLKLAQARHELEAFKRDQTAMLVHDLKQPLAIISLRAEFIADEGAHAEMVQSAHAIRHACRQMEQLINTVLELSRVDAGQLTLCRSSVPILDLVFEVTEQLSDLAARREIALNVHATHALPAVPLDRPKVIQVLQNLIGNALKFTPPGGQIDVRVARMPGAVMVAVEDSGPGLTEADVGALFDRWRQTKEGRAKGGSGLGLAIARAIVEAHGGHIGARARSDGQHGACFWLSLPLPALTASG
jgi:signal transduction histidine kinase